MTPTLPPEGAVLPGGTSAAIFAAMPIGTRIEVVTHCYVRTTDAVWLRVTDARGVSNAELECCGARVFVLSYPRADAPVGKPPLPVHVYVPPSRAALRFAIIDRAQDAALVVKHSTGERKWMRLPVDIYGASISALFYDADPTWRP